MMPYTRNQQSLRAFGRGMRSSNPSHRRNSAFVDKKHQDGEILDRRMGRAINYCAGSDQVCARRFGCCDIEPIVQMSNPRLGRVK